MPDFTHLHVHTQYSILDGACNIKELMLQVKEYGMSSIAITDHGNMYGVLEFVNAAKSNGIKPIIGCEMYVADGSRFEKKGKEDRSGYHLILLAKNKTGYHNLARLCSLSFKRDAFYYTPRIDKELLKKYHEGIIASTACLGGEVASAILNHDIDKAEQVIQEYVKIFGEDFYLEMQDHGLPDQMFVNKELILLSQKFNIPLVATNDVHFLNAEDAKAHDILVCLNTGKDFEDENRMKYSGKEYLRSPQEMEFLFSSYPEALKNTMRIAEKIEDYNLAHKIILPSFPIPEPFTEENEYLKHLTFEGAKKCYPKIDESLTERIKFELDVVAKMGFAGYFLIVQDFINEAKKMGISVGPGRGSAAGSVVAFCIGITNIDPIKYNLLFERFLNPERVSMPDIDIDFDDENRDLVIEYVVKKYGNEKVAQIVTFGTMASKSAIRDVARVLKLPLAESDRLAKLVPTRPDINLEKAFKEVPELLAAFESEKSSQLVKDTLFFAKKLEGSIRHTGVHACGIIIGPDNLMEFTPLSTAKDTDLMVTQYEGTLVESVGMLKMDFLGLKTLSIIKDAIENIYHRHKILIDIDKIPLDDKLTFELYQRGDTVGTFQFESEGMRTYLKDLKPNNIEDLIAMNALYRPGPMDYIPLFINRKQGRIKTEYPHPMLEEILKPTYGIMIYQEQIMQTAQIMGGFTLGGADLLRRAMGKKKKDIMEKQQIVFVEGAIKKGIDKSKAEEVFQIMERFAEYGFNRSHSAAYSVIAYQTAYLKAHYPAEYMASVLTHNLNDIKKITFFMDECKRQNLMVLGPDVNESVLKFTVNAKGQIRFGLGAIKNVGEAAVDALVEECNLNGPFQNIFDIAKRANLRAINKRCLESLAMAGAFDNFPGIHRAQYFYKGDGDESNFLEKVIKHANNVQTLKQNSQASLFGESEGNEIADPSIPNCDQWTKLEQINKEKEVTGFYISGHPLDEFKVELENFCNVTISDLNENLNNYKNRDIIFGGVINTALHKTTKTGKPFGTFVIEDFNDSIQIALFSDDYIKYKSYLEKGYFLIIKAKVQYRYNTTDQLEIKIQSINLLADVLEKWASKLTLKLTLSQISDDFVEQISKTIISKKGKCALRFTVYDTLNNISVDMVASKYNVDCSKLLKNLSADFPDVKFKIN